MSDSPSVPTEYQLTRLIYQILMANYPDAEVAANPTIVEGATGNVLRPDFIVTRGKDSEVFEVVGSPPLTARRIDELRDRLLRVRDAVAARGGTTASATLVITADLTRAKRELLADAGIRVWGRDRLFSEFRAADISFETQWFSGTSQAGEPAGMSAHFQSELLAVDVGRTQWVRYQKLCANIFQYLFCPPLAAPIEESWNDPKVNRRDFVLPNYATDGIWQFLRMHYQADFVVVDAKNLTGFVAKAHILQICNYMSARGTGLFGIVASRTGLGRAATYTQREQWVLHGKLVVILQDDDLRQMLESRAAGADPALVILQKIEDFRLGV